MVQIISKRLKTITITQAGKRQPLSEKTLFVTNFILQAKSANTGANFYWGDKTVSNAWAAYSKGTIWDIKHGTGNQLGADHVGEWDLSKIYVDSDSNGDIILCEYFVKEKK